MLKWNDNEQIVIGFFQRKKDVIQQNDFSIGKSHCITQNIHGRHCRVVAGKLKAPLAKANGVFWMKQDAYA